MNQVSELKQHIKALQDEIRSIQEECSHDKVVYKYKSDTGNYDPSCDSYWIEIDCLCCNKHIHIDSETEPHYYRSFENYYGKDLCVTEEEYEVLKSTGVLK